jgi:hypothetical protein
VVGVSGPFEDWSADAERTYDAGQPPGSGSPRALPPAWATDPEVSDLDRRIGALLLTFNGAGGIWPGIPRLARELGYTPRWIRARLAHLEERGYVERLPVYEQLDDPAWTKRSRSVSHLNRQTSNEYVIHQAGTPRKSLPSTDPPEVVSTRITSGDPPEVRTAENDPPEVGHRDWSTPRKSADSSVHGLLPPLNSEGTTPATNGEGRYQGGEGGDPGREMDDHVGADEPAEIENPDPGATHCCSRCGKLHSPRPLVASYPHSGCGGLWLPLGAWRRSA